MCPWPAGVDRVPDEPWTQARVDQLAKDYDTVEQHGWYTNLDFTVSELVHRVDDGDIVLDYSGGTGILADQLLSLTEREIRVLLVDSSRKFLRLAIEKLGEDPRVAFRLIAYLEDEGRLERVDEILEPALVEEGIRAIVSTNAIHLYYDLEDTLSSWRRIIREDGFVHAQSGSIDRASRPEDRWILDATVKAVDEAARRIVQEDDAFARHRSRLQDEDLMAEYESLRDRFFQPARDLSYYTDRFEQAGFTVESVKHRPIPVDVGEWAQFLTVYHEGVLGWVGGSDRVEDATPSPQDVQDREALIEAGLERVMEDARTFEAEWTYVTCRPS